MYQAGTVTAKAASHECKMFIATNSQQMIFKTG